MPLPKAHAQLRQRQASRALMVASGTLSYLPVRGGGTRRPCSTWCG
jgi:hypothetical protein